MRIWLRLTLAFCMLLSLLVFGVVPADACGSHPATDAWGTFVNHVGLDGIADAAYYDSCTRELPEQEAAKTPCSIRTEILDLDGTGIRYPKLTGEAPGIGGVNEWFRRDAQEQRLTGGDTKVVFHPMYHLNGVYGGIQIRYLDNPAGQTPQEKYRLVSVRGIHFDLETGRQLTWQEQIWKGDRERLVQTVQCGDIEHRIRETVALADRSTRYRGIRQLPENYILDHGVIVFLFNPGEVCTGWVYRYWTELYAACAAFG
ncbi:MAG TPA: hypothetical protein DCY37_01765 [Acidaminococcaceae bacterium]|nr:hypothetical protein [Acidaminococcaceae bacterium]